jgi:hypothetical protein
VSGERRLAFADAFYRQAWSDWQAYKLLAEADGLPRCHALHYLQMACEKLAKAYRLRDTAGDVDAPSIGPRPRRMRNTPGSAERTS